VPPFAICHVDEGKERHEGTQIYPYTRVTLTGEAENKVIEAARRSYEASKPAVRISDGERLEVTTHKFIARPVPSKVAHNAS
jgi:hypothetical protein